MIMLHFGSSDNSAKICSSVASCAVNPVYGVSAIRQAPREIAMELSDAGLLLLQLCAPEAILPARNACRCGGESPSSLDQNSSAGSLLQYEMIAWPYHRVPRTDA